VSSPRRTGAVAVAVLGAAALVALPARPAQARLVDLYVGGTAGGVTGWGTTPQTPDFFDSTRGGGLGFDLGVKVLFIDLSATFLQVLNGSGTSGTLIQLLLGGEIDVPLGDAKLSDGQSQNVLKPKLAGGFGFGTPGAVSPPLTDSQISAKGVVANGTLGYEYFLNPFLGIGAEATFGYHYFFGGDVVNSSQSHSSGYHILGLATVTFHLGY
jgi:hypothetical protein